MKIQGSQLFKKCKSFSPGLQQVLMLLPLDLVHLPDTDPQRHQCWQTYWRTWLVSVLLLAFGFVESIFKTKQNWSSIIKKISSFLLSLTLQMRLVDVVELQVDFPFVTPWFYFQIPFSMLPYCQYDEEVCDIDPLSWSLDHKKGGSLISCTNLWGIELYSCYYLMSLVCWTTQILE